MTWSQISAPLYVAAGILYSWKRLVDEDGPEIRRLGMLTGHQAVPVLDQRWCVVHVCSSSFSPVRAEAARVLADHSEESGV